MSLREETKELKLALYTRVSTDEQANRGFSLDEQLDKLRSHCENKEWIVAGEYQDPGFSGRNIRRPGYTKMMEDIDQWDGILILKMDRIHRNSKNFLAMMEELIKGEKQFISFYENLDTSTAMGRFVMNIIQYIAQLESEQIGERVSFALNAKAKKAESFMGHRTAFGYTWDPDKKRFIPNMDQLAIVKRVFELYLEGKSMRGITRELGQDFKKVNPKNKPLANTTAKYFLHNSFYAGYDRWCQHFRRIPESELPESLIDRETFNQVQIMMSEKCRTHNWKPLLIKDLDNFALDKEMVKSIPVINRAKHNYNF